MPINSKGRYYPQRLSIGKRNELLRFNDALYGQKENGIIMPAKTNSKSPAKQVATATYVDQNGIEQTIDLAQVKNLGDTTYDAENKLFPNATAAFVKNTSALYDSEGRVNLLGENLILVDAIRMNSGDYGPGFMVQGIHSQHGEVKFFAPGLTVHAVESMSGIALNDRYDEKRKLEAKAGDRFRASEFPVACRFIHSIGGDYDGYYNVVPAAQEVLESSE